MVPVAASFFIPTIISVTDATDKEMARTDARAATRHATFAPAIFPRLPEYESCTSPPNSARPRKSSHRCGVETTVTVDQPGRLSRIVHVAACKQQDATGA